MFKSISNFLADPVAMRKFNGWSVIFWIIMIPVALVTGWISSVVFVSAISIWALVASHLSGWQSARVEVVQAEQAKELLEHPPEEKVVKAIIEKTDVEPLN